MAARAAPAAGVAGGVVRGAIGLIVGPAQRRNRQRRDAAGLTRVLVVTVPLTPVIAIADGEVGQAGQLLVRAAFLATAGSLRRAFASAADRLTRAEAGTLVGSAAGAWRRGGGVARGRWGTGAQTATGGAALLIRRPAAAGTTPGATAPPSDGNGHGCQLTTGRAQWSG